MEAANTLLTCRNTLKAHYRSTQPPGVKEESILSNFCQASQNTDDIGHDLFLIKQLSACCSDKSSNAGTLGNC